MSTNPRREKVTTLEEKLGAAETENEILRVLLKESFILIRDGAKQPAAWHNWLRKASGLLPRLKQYFA